MNHAISNAFLFNIVITFVIVLIAFFIGSLSYSKAAKVKNYIISEIEKYGQAALDDQEEVDKAYENASENILAWLNNGDGGTSIGIGYRKVRNGDRACPDVRDIDTGALVEDVTSAGSGSSVINPYEYCVYRIKSCVNDDADGSKNSGCYTYFKVRTYMYFDVPIIEDLVKIPVEGETMGFMVKNS